MPFVTAPTHAELAEAIRETTQRYCALAFAADLRCAMRWRFKSILDLTVEYEFLMLSPGEYPPLGQGWELFENHSGFAIGREL